MNNFWINKPSVLYENNNYLKIFPSSNMTTYEQLNAITRLCLYYLVVLIILKKNASYIVFPLMVLFFVIIIYYKQKNESYDNIILNDLSNNDLSKLNKQTNLDNESKIENNISCDNEPLACNADDNNVYEEKINNDDNMFVNNIFKNMNENFEQKNMERIWHTGPTHETINNQDGFANWLYKTNDTCKTNQQQCLNFDDLRFASMR